MATKQEIKQGIIKAINDKIISKGNISAVDTNKILLDILDFSDNPVTPPINSFDFGNLEKPLETKQLASVKVNFTGIEKLSCTLYICIQARILDSQDSGDNSGGLFFPLEDKNFEILQSFLPDINKKQMYLTFIVPFFRAQQKESAPIDTEPTTGLNLESSRMMVRAVSKQNDFPLTIFGIGLLITPNKQKGVHILLPEIGHISTSVALLYKPNTFEFGLFTDEFQKSLDTAFNNIIEGKGEIFD